MAASKTTADELADIVYDILLMLMQNADALNLSVNELQMHLDRIAKLDKEPA